MSLNQAVFLLDENVDYRLRSLLDLLNLTHTTVQQQGWSGVNNSSLAQKLKASNFILITRDRDFVFLWKKFQLRVIYLAIHPPLLIILKNELENLFTNWIYDLTQPFLIIIQRGLIRSFK